jgi:hypothetical protein
VTARDTHELRLDQWPRLSTFPTTNAVIAGAILLDFLTFAAWAFGRSVPEGWLFFLAGLHGIGTAHFGIKRKTDFRNGSAKPVDAPVPNSP